MINKDFIFGFMCDGKPLEFGASQRNHIICFKNISGFWRKETVEKEKELAEVRLGSHFSSTCEKYVAWTVFRVVGW